MTEKSVAILTLKDVSKMSPQSREDIAQWLESHANFLRCFGDDEELYASVYRARFFLNEEV